MKNPLIWLVAGGALLYWFFIRGKNTTAAPAAATTNPNTAGFLAPWSNFLQGSGKATSDINQTGSILTGAGNAFTGFANAVKGIFGTNAGATPANPIAKTQYSQPIGPTLPQSPSSANSNQPITQDQIDAWYASGGQGEPGDGSSYNWSGLDANSSTPTTTGDLAAGSFDAQGNFLTP